MEPGVGLDDHYGFLHIQDILCFYISIQNKSQKKNSKLPGLVRFKEGLPFESSDKDFSLRKKKNTKPGSHNKAILNIRSES